ncbi:MAG: hypothetical protein GX973_01820 [Firmicutes bacterium]|nr:hypothetical protein [Bacillota bacterium]
MGAVNREETATAPPVPAPTPGLKPAPEPASAPVSPKNRESTPTPLPPSRALVTTPIMGREEKAGAIQKRKGSLLCPLLAVLLLVQIMVVALYGWPGFAVGGFGKTSSFTLAVGETAVTTKSGVSVDFGLYNEMDGTRVRVKELAGKMDKVQGGYLTSFDISARGRDQFDSFITITLLSSRPHPWDLMGKRSGALDIFILHVFQGWPARPGAHAEGKQRSACPAPGGA